MVPGDKHSGNKKRVEEIFEQSDYELEYFLIADEETLKETDFFYKDKTIEHLSLYL